MSRALAGAFLVTGAVLIWLAPSAATSPHGPKFHVAARLVPDEVVGRAPNVEPGARGAFEASVNAYWRGGQTISPSLRYVDTTDAVRVHIHAGARGAVGPILYKVCAPASRSNPISCRSPLRFFNWGFFAWVPDLVHRPAYVDVHTKRNPQGELRGQLSVRQVP